MPRRSFILLAVLCVIQKDKTMKYHYLIVGSGLYGATFAHLAGKAGKSVLVIDRRGHLGGNVYCESVDGINVHKYGAHIFHTSNKRVWDFVNQFVSFNRYTNSPIANYKGKLYSLPFNMNTFYQMWQVTTPAQAFEIIDRQRKAAGILEPGNLEEQAISLVGRDIYEVLVKEYTEKQWGRKCSDLPASIIKRLPVRFTYDNNYFDDLYQGVPVGGYNGLVGGLLQGIETKTGIDFFEDREKWEQAADKIVFTGRIDEFYDYRYGRLEYRTVRFETEKINVQNYQGNAVINFTSREPPYTRIIEHKHFEPEGPAYANDCTFISKEFPAEWKDGMECFYPVNDQRNSRVYSKYRELADKEERVVFGGRLAEYKYYDMDDVIERAIEDAENYIF